MAKIKAINSFIKYDGCGAAISSDLVTVYAEIKSEITILKVSLNQNQIITKLIYL